VLLADPDDRGAVLPHLLSQLWHRDICGVLPACEFQDQVNGNQILASMPIVRKILQQSLLEKPAQSSSAREIWLERNCHTNGQASND
jgi:hypothetical protein